MWFVKDRVIMFKFGVGGRFFFWVGVMKVVFF